MHTYNSTIITDEAIELLKSFELPEDLAFGKVMVPVMIEADYDNGTWGEFKMVPFRKLELDPTCKVLHYAQEIFEGLKGYYTEERGPYLFRPTENVKRFNDSAKRMAMPTLDEKKVLDAIEAMASYSAHLTPTRSGDSLYIRPFMIATENSLGIKPSEKFKFMIVASPSQAYFSSGSVKVLVERDAVRACPGGVGHAKTGGNYAASLLSMIAAKEKGYDQVLWLDAVTKTNIEEMSGMNFFAVYGDKVIKTPKLTQTILDGITRKSIIQLASHLGFEVKEETLSIDQLLNDIKSGACTEAFACGTAVIITPINTLGLASGETYELAHEQGPTTMKLREHLLNLQEGVNDDPFNWRVELKPVLK